MLVKPMPAVFAAILPIATHIGDKMGQHVAPVGGQCSEVARAATPTTDGAVREPAPRLVRDFIFPGGVPSAFALPGPIFRINCRTSRATIEGEASTVVAKC
jgi:hypothetical protein